MTKVPAYHTNKDPEDPRHHVYDDCPAGERVIKDGNKQPGTGGFPMCKFCRSKLNTGKF
jgi:hypothetical protein